MFNLIKERKFTAVLAISFFMYGVLLMLFFFFFTNWLIEKKKIEQFKYSSIQQAQSKEEYLHLYLNSLSRSLRSVAFNPYFMSYVANKKYIDSAEFIFLTIMLEHDDYMQLRFIDKSGMELLRYDRDKIDSPPYKKEKLQDKSNRYYFREAIKLKEGEVYTSKIDFNVENGKVAQPFVPVFRISTPIYFKGELMGVLTINTFAKKIVELFTTSATYDITILDKDWWVIYYKGKFYDKSINGKEFKDIFPNIDIHKISEATLTKEHLYIKPISMGTEKIYIALKSKPSSILKLKSEDYKMLSILLFLLLLTAIPLSFILSRPSENIFIAFKRQEAKLENLTHTLEERVLEKTKENSKKDRLLIHQARLTELGEMIGNISHQWRQPITRLSLLIQNLKAFYKKGRLSKEIMEDTIEKAQEQIHFMSDTIDNFKDFYRQNEYKENFLVKESYKSVISMIGYHLKHNNIALEYIDRENLEIYGNKNEFSQVLLNIIVNAKDALLENGIEKPKITINVYKRGNSAFIEIKDNGGGIKQDNIKEIFEPYFTTKGEKGTGIGLYIVKTIIEEKFGGSAKIKNFEDGVLFVIEIPKKS